MPVLSSHAAPVVDSEPTRLNRFDQWCVRREVWLAVAGIVFFFLLNLSIASRSPFGGWMDETFEVDPALNLATGKGWTSTAWFYQTDREFWAQNSPLYPAALTGWVRVFGGSMVATRAYCYFLGALGTFLFWLAALRLKLLTPSLRLFWLALLSLEYSTNWMMRNQRYDVWIFVGLGVALLGTSLARPAARHGLIFLGCFLGPLAGFISLPYLVMLAGLLTLLAGFSRWQESVTVLLGAGCGLVAVLAFYAWHGQLATFLHMVKNLSAAGATPSPVEKLRIFLYPVDDIGLILLLIALLLLTMVGHRNRTVAGRCWLWLGWGIVLVMPCLMLARTKFPVQYFYLVVIPLSLSVLALLVVDAPVRRPRLVSVTVIILLGMACLGGLPARLFTSLKEWQLRDPRHLHDFVHRYLGPDDCVVADSKFYFALRGQVRFSATPLYLWVIPPDEAAKINVVLLSTAEFPDVTRDTSKLERLGGGWKKIAIFPTEEMRSNFPNWSHATPEYILYRR